MDVDSKNIGSFFIVSFPERIPSDETLHFIQDNGIAGIILFADHCHDQDSLKSWLADFKRSLGRTLLVAVDQEGGRVRRFRRHFPELEAPRYYGHKEDLSQYRSDLSRVCERLYEIGINVNLVPVVDLLDTQGGHVLDTRTFSDKPEVVSLFARETVAVHKNHGLLTCAKHFPGLGRSQGDPHSVPAAANLTEDDFRKIELPPFVDIISAGVDAVMVTHLLALRIDDVPAVLSKAVITGWLKENLSFAGPVITDDLLMAGATGFDTVECLAGRSFNAGADVLLFGQNLKSARSAFNAFVENREAGRIEDQRVQDALARVTALLKKVVS